MTYKTRATGDALTVKLWSKEIQEESPRQSFWLSKLAGMKFLDTNGKDIKELKDKHYIQNLPNEILDQSGVDAIVHVFTDLQETIGDRLTIPAGFQLDENSGQVEGGTLEGNEAQMDDTSYNVTLAEYRNGVARRGKLADRRSHVTFESRAIPTLKQWQATKIDNVINGVMLASPTEIYYPTAAGTLLTATPATAALAMTATTLITPDLINTLIAAADTGRQGVRNKFTRIIINGKGWYVMLVPTDVAGDMLQNNTWQNIANSAWTGKGDSHPLLSNAMLTYQNVIVVPYEKMPIYTDGGAGAIPYGRSLFMGAGALSFCFGQKEPSLTMQEKDYGYIKGIAIDHIFGCAKPTITNNTGALFTFDDNSFSVYTSRTQRSDITLV